MKKQLKASRFEELVFFSTKIQILSICWEQAYMSWYIFTSRGNFILLEQINGFCAEASIM